MQTRRMCLSGQQRMTHGREMNFDVCARPMGSVYAIYMKSFCNLDKLYEKSSRGLCDLYARPNEVYVRSTYGLYEVYTKSIY